MDLVRRITIRIPMEVITTQMITDLRAMIMDPTVDTQVRVEVRDMAQAHRRSKVRFA